MNTPLSRFVPSLQRCAQREGGRHQRGGAALARWPLAWAMPAQRQRPMHSLWGVQ